MSSTKENLPETPKPEWAVFFDDEEYQAFMAAIDHYFAVKQMPYEIGDGIITIQSKQFGGGQLGLVNIAQVCKQNCTSDYSSIVLDYFDMMERAKQFNDEFESNTHNFEYVKPYLAVRLYHNSYVETLDTAHTMGKPFAGDIFATLVYDLPDTVINVKPKQAEQWGKTLDELMTVGLKNINQKYTTEIFQQKVNNVDFYIADADHFYVPDIVFSITEHPQLIGSKGSLVGLPHRHSAFFYPIEGKDVLDVTSRMIPVIYNLCEQGPGSLSDNLFWYYNGTFTEIPYELDENNSLQISPPESFYDLLGVIN